MQGEWGVSRWNAGGIQVLWYQFNVEDLLVSLVIEHRNMS
jgi:hypothetical protein